MLHHSPVSPLPIPFPVASSCARTLVTVARSSKDPVRPHQPFLRHLGRAAIAAVALAALGGPAHAGSLYLARLNGANEIPPTTSTATGFGALVLNDAENNAVITATHDISLPLTGGHIHRGAATVNGPVIFPFPAPTTSVGPLTWAIPAAEVVNLKALGLYVNFHTSVNPGGAIRGQLVRALLAPAATTTAQSRIAAVLDVSAGYDAEFDQILVQTNLASLAIQTQTLNDLTARTAHAPARQQIEAMTSLRDSLLAHADEARWGNQTTAGQWSSFLRGGQEFGDRDSNANQAGSSISRPFVLAGVDYRLSEQTRGGFALGYADAKDDFDGGVGRTKSKTTAIQAFLSTQAGASDIRLDGAAGYGWSQGDSTRSIASLGRTATGSPDGTVWSATLRASRLITLANQSLLEPYALLDAQEATVDAYSETGAGSTGLVYSKRTSWNSALEVGATLIVPIKTDSGALTARARIGWHHLLEDGADTFSTRMIGLPTAFETQIDGIGANAARVELSMTAKTKDGVLATLGYRGMVGASGQTTHAVEIGFNLKL